MPCTPIDAIPKQSHYKCSFDTNALHNSICSISEYTWLITLHHTHVVHRCDLWLHTSHVVWSVCLSVGYTGELCKNCWNDRDVVWETDSCGSKEPCIRWESRSDESICCHDGWHNGDAAFCQITLYTCLFLYRQISTSSKYMLAL